MEGSILYVLKLFFISFQNYVTLKNDNYFPVDITSIEMTVQYDTIVIDTVKNSTIVKVPIRDENSYFVQANITLDKQNQMGYMAYVLL